MKLSRLLFISALLILLLSAFCPWISRDTAEHRAAQAFEKNWEGVSDGCGFNCDGCGARSSEKTLFGWKVVLEYAFGMLPSDSPEYHKNKSVFVSFLFTVHNL